MKTVYSVMATIGLASLGLHAAEWALSPSGWVLVRIHLDALGTVVMLYQLMKCAQVDSRKQ